MSAAAEVDLFIYRVTSHKPPALAETAGNAKSLVSVIFLESNQSIALLQASESVPPLQAHVSDECV